MEKVAIGLLVLYFAVAFGLRMFIHWRLTGTTGFQGIRGKVGSLEWFAGVLLALAVLGSASSPVLVLFGMARPLPVLDSSGSRAAGLTIFLLGFGVTFAAQMKMGRSWRIGVNKEERTQLVTDGLFSTVRNPIFSAMLLAFLGLTLMVPTVLAVCCWLTLLISLELHVRFVEEPYLRRIHGDNYAQYASRVGRFIPWLGTLRV
jgi:protein-S-isoprenylcysteine O-methyltransferase Ste14